MRDWLALRRRATPTRTAVVDARTGETISYRTLDDRVADLAGRLSTLGIESNDHVGVLARTRPAVVELAHAAARLGAVLVPLNARFTADEVETTLARADVDTLVCEAETEPHAVAATDGAVSLDPPTEGARDLAGVAESPFEPGAWDRERTQLLLATSGTTGGPKLVELTMGNLWASAAASSWRLGVLPDDRWYCTLPMYHMGGVAPVYRSVLYGTAVVVATPGSFDPTRALAEMARYDATCVSLVPTMLEDLLNADSAGVLTELRFVLTGGAATPAALVERARAAEVALCPSYGMTEAASQIATARPAETAAAPGSVGHPLMSTDVSIIQPDGTEAVPGASGEIVVDGPTVTPGYYGNQEATEAAFSPQGLHTGDVGRLDSEGRLWVLNRLDDRIVTGGENVNPGEVADVLRDHPSVTDAFVLGLPDETYGQRVAAVVATADPVEPSALESFARERLAGFKLPRTWRVVDELPRTASGTVDREAARALFENG